MSIDFSNPQSNCGFDCPDGFVQFRNYWCFEEYACKDTFFGEESPLPLWVGYFIILGFGVAFGLFTLLLVWLDRKILGTNMTSEQFNTAGRSVGIGLTASVIVSQWTWAATLLQSSNVAYKYGISGPFWYAAGATIQVILFSILSIQVKRRAPTAHTFLEIVRARWGTGAHILFLCFALATNVIVTSMLILGGSATVSALTGMNVDLASFLIPLGTIFYTLAGGLKATFIASYFNTSVILVSLCIFSIYVNAFSPDLGSSDAMWDALTSVADVEPVVDNQDGSYMTMMSKGGLVFGVINVIGNFGTVFVDQSYWQSAIAATPTASYKGYILGGLCWFAIPFTLATTLGIANVALSLPLTFDEAASGLVPPATAHHLMGNGGSGLILVMLFMAVTSTGSAELIGVSSVVAYDVYRTYINPNCTGEQIIKVSRAVILIFGLLMGVLGIALNHIGISLGWLYLAMGVMIGSAVFPVAYSITWSGCTATGAVAGAGTGLVSALIVWLVYAKVGYGSISIDTLGEDYVMLAANLVAIFVSGIVCTAVSLIWREDSCDWENTTMKIPLVERDLIGTVYTDKQTQEMNLISRRILYFGFGLTIVLVILWPVLTIPAGVFSKGYWKFWVTLSILWGVVATILMVCLPVYEARQSILAVLTWGRVMLPDAIPDSSTFNSDKVEESVITKNGTVEEIESLNQGGMEFKK
eukprot:CFRG3171T1